jgi:hypothetical protein
MDEKAGKRERKVGCPTRPPSPLPGKDVRNVPPDPEMRNGIAGGSTGTGNPQGSLTGRNDKTPV